MKAYDDQDSIIERSWELVKEALTRGTITLESDDSTKPFSIRMLETEDVVKLAQFFVQLKVKKPTAITIPEDFQMKPTGGDDED